MVAADPPTRQNDPRAGPHIDLVQTIHGAIASISLFLSTVSGLLPRANVVVKLAGAIGTSILTSLVTLYAALAVAIKRIIQISFTLVTDLEALRSQYRFRRALAKKQPAIEAFNEYLKLIEQQYQHNPIALALARRLAMEALQAGLNDLTPYSTTTAHIEKNKHQNPSEPERED